MSARNVWLILVSIFVAPAIGGLVFFTFAALTDTVILSPHGQPTSFVNDYWPIILVAAYVLGVIPAFVTALIMIFVGRLFPHAWQRLLAGTLVGALVSAIGIGFFIFSDNVGSVDDVIIIGGVALTGAVSAFCSLGLIELWHPLKPKPPAAIT